jgi:hypothetical protein
LFDYKSFAILQYLHSFAKGDQGHVEVAGGQEIPPDAVFFFLKKKVNLVKIFQKTNLFTVR